MANDLNAWFSAIKWAYDSYYKTLLKAGKMPLRSTEVGFWGAAVADEIWDLFMGYLNLYSAKNFIDLGSGDGKVVLLASLFTKATGIEHDKDLHAVAEHIRKHFKLPNANFINGNYFDHDLSKYDVIFINPDQPLARLEKKLLQEMKGKLVVYGHLYHPPSLKKIRSFTIGGTPIAVYSHPHGL
ncbi:hypothetical protein J4457_02915 [Candidatus Woesearchaeota archaeon]|nr:hypothetical protein [Candidatus Woesearchaeota archaeon]